MARFDLWITSKPESEIDGRTNEAEIASNRPDRSAFSHVVPEVPFEVAKRTLLLNKGKMRPPSPFIGTNLAEVPEATLDVGRLLADMGRTSGFGFQGSANKSAHAMIAAETTAKIDRFAADLARRRNDLKGLPLRLAPNCSLSPDRTTAFSLAVADVHHCFGETLGRSLVKEDEDRWDRFAQGADALDRKIAKENVDPFDDLVPGRIAALTQVFDPESAEHRIGLAKYLGAVRHPEASRAIARLAIFSDETEVRAAALSRLKSRRFDEYDEVLRSGLRYPDPRVAERAMEVIAKLDRKDLAGEVLKLLEECDPRSPKPTADMKAMKIRELVRIRHASNCLLCHPPATPAEFGSLLQGKLAGLAAVREFGPQEPTKPIPLFDNVSGFYNSAPNHGDPSIRIDVTFLKQDFSRYLDRDSDRVRERFDFLVRERLVTPSEAANYEKSLLPGSNRLNPYHRAAITTLRELTKQDVAPTAEAWRAVVAELR
jgi:hypothetical protein